MYLKMYLNTQNCKRHQLRNLLENKYSRTINAHSTVRNRSWNKTTLMSSECASKTRKTFTSASVLRITLERKRGYAKLPREELEVI